CHQYNGYPRTF
nr:immunoglobulin light chain junction region [Macaca mulatta]MOX48475.1 immunoglobulin light chain junction region [Macaca mulatta]MOX48595.1 immunoglobulin light chain junction region [Macaca mulatta]MOX48861.1 immunoglobulin light chain junction region [Macaca mulatta]MOX49025.1 immunoglobulin light chain junction region [Macaca mulatta]